MTSQPNPSNGKPRVLFVDDEPAILSGLSRQLRGNYDVVTTTDAASGLEMLEKDGPFDVVISDMRMPEMDGATFLAHARHSSVDTTRILLTGQSDIESAAAAVNQGQIFRFLTKPCPVETMRQCLRDAVDQHRQAQAQREIMDRALLPDPRPDLEKATAELVEALAKDQFSVWYQPVVDLETGITTGAEALIRWQHPERGLIPPDQFIAIAEATGQIRPIGQWVLEQACQDAARWPVPEGREPLTLAVNLSPQQLNDPRLIDGVKRALSRSGWPPSRLVLELTETALLTDRQHTPALLHGLRNMGISIAVDDFGTGYSSLAYLQALPVDILKVDRSFVTSMPASTSIAVAKAIVHLGHTLRLEIIAEGIENDVQWDNCKDIGCQHGQGFLFAKPMDNSHFQALLSSKEIMS